MRIVSDVEQLHSHRFIFIGPVLVDGLDGDWPGTPRLRVRLDRAWLFGHAPVERLVGGLRDDCQSFRHSCANPARVIEMMMRVDDLGHRLAGHEFVSFGDDAQPQQLAEAFAGVLAEPG